MDETAKKIKMTTNLDTVAEMMSSFLQKPIIIENNQFSLLAYSAPQIEQFDEANKRTIFTKQWPLSIVEAFMDAGIIHQLETIRGPFRVPHMEQIGLNPRTVVSAVYKDRVFGYIWVQETEGALEKEQIDFLDTVSHHVGKILYEQNELKESEAQKSTQFYRKMLSGGFQSDEEMMQAFSAFNRPIPSSLTAVLLAAPGEADSVKEDLLETTRLFVKALNCPNHVFVMNRRITVIIGSSVQKEELQRSAEMLVQTISNQFSAHAVQAGIGNVYSEFSSLQKSYKEAEQVMKTAELAAFPVPAVYSGLGVLRYLETVQHYNEQMQYANTDVLKLKQKDLESQTELVRTLDAYLRANCRIKPAAEQLFIHTNTLKYRLKQITELTDIRFDDFAANCQLFLDLQLMK